MKRYDVAIIGGGPAGLKAAIELAKRNCKVIIIDENYTLGGKLNVQLHEGKSKGNWWIGKEVAESLISEANKYDIHFQLSTQVWNIEEGWRLHLSKIDSSERLSVVESDYILLATGAIEQGLPLKGWTLPRVLTVGGAQVLNNQYFIKPGNKVAIIGIDILSLSIARTMKLSGVEVEGIYLLPKNEFSKDLSYPETIMKKFKDMGENAPNYLLKLGTKIIQSKIGRKLALKFYPNYGIKVWGIPIFMNKCVKEIYGMDGVEGIKIYKVDSNGNEIQYVKNESVDAVCISAGLVPQTELAVLIGCEFVKIDGLSGNVPLHSNRMKTTVPKVFVAGNITGIEGAEVCMQQGVVAGTSILNEMGLASDIELTEAISKLDEVREDASIQFDERIIEGRNKLEEIWLQHTSS